MLKTNVMGGIAVVSIVCTLVGIAMALKISIDWSFYFKALGIVAILALAISAIIHIIPSKNINNNT